MVFDNSVKKFEAEEESLIPSDKTEPLGDITKYLATISKEKVAYGSCFSLNDDYAALVFSDSGSPMDISSLISKLRKRMLKEPHNMIDWVSPQMRKHFENWSENDFAWNLITLEDVANIAFMARIRGSDIPQTIVGGMGLYGVKCLLEHVGGAILYTTTYKEETPMFIYIIPKYPTKSKEEAQSIRTGFINGAIKVG